MTHYKTFPFSAIIGQDDMKLALILNAINPRIGGVLIQGTKGTAKSTAVRALADLLPDIDIIKDCSFNCNPKILREACHLCQEKIKNAEIGNKEIAHQRMRVVNLPINASEDRVIGTIDIQKALKEGIKALEPGLLAEANRNILYIDEVNLLADNVADILLDAAAMGINIIEREGISIHHPANFILVGTMNPEEGNLRPQLLDRFGLSVNAEVILDIDKRIQVIEAAESYQQDPHAFYLEYRKKTEKLKERIIQARERLDSVEINKDYLKQISTVCVKFNVGSLRADITMSRVAKTIAAFHRRSQVNLDDIKKAAKLVLPHRLARLPFEDKELNDNELEQHFQEPENESNAHKEQNTEQSKERKAESNEKTHESNQNSSNNKAQSEAASQPKQIFSIKQGVAAPPLQKKRITKIMKSSGRRVSHPTGDSHGKMINSYKPRNLKVPRFEDIEINATLNNTALSPENCERLQSNQPLKINEADICLKRRTGKSSYLIIFCVDASGSMGTENRMESVKGAIFSILQDNYVFRDKVSLVTFQEKSGKVILPPTRSTDLAFKYLKEIPTGGTTPLISGLHLSVQIAKEERLKDTGYIPIIILLSDGKGNVEIQNIPKKIRQICKEIAIEEIPLVIIDTEGQNCNLGITKEMAKNLKSPYYCLEDLTRQNLESVLETEGILQGGTL